MNNFSISGDGSVVIGQSSIISNSSQIIFNKPGTVTVGDYCTIGPGVKIVCSGGNVHIGDWTTLHDGCLILSGKHVFIGQHCWFGQNCIIDGSGGLTVGRGVRVGMYSQIWSHVAAGEQIEGCTLYGEREVIIEDNVWLVGSCIVSSGVIVGSRSVALIGSNITKSVPSNSVIAGSPAVPKPNLTFYKDITLDEKWQLLSNWLKSATDSLNITIEFADNNLIEISSTKDNGKIVFARDQKGADLVRTNQQNSTVCCIEDKSYNKQYTPLEKNILKYLSGNKARFYSK